MFVSSLKAWLGLRNILWPTSCHLLCGGGSRISACGNRRDSRRSADFLVGWRKGAAMVPTDSRPSGYGRDNSLHMQGGSESLFVHVHVHLNPVVPRGHCRWERYPLCKYLE